MSTTREEATTQSNETSSAGAAEGHAVLPAAPTEEVLDPQTERSGMWKYLDRRFGLTKAGLKPFVLEAMNSPHPRFMNPLDYMGDVLLFLFVNQIVTGLLLMTRYDGSAMAAGTAANPFPAFATTLAMTHQFWWAFVRDLHFWGANAMVIAIAIHMARVFYVGAYKPPREFQWLSGLILLACTIGLALSGYLLPWDQQAYWATEVATAMVKYVPFIGHSLLYFVRGCRYTCAHTLTFFFAIHVVLLPLILVLTIGLHVLLVIIHGQVDVEARLPAEYRKKHRFGVVADFPKGYVPFWPNIVTNITLYSAAVAVILVLIAANIPAPLTAQANYVNVPPAVPLYYRPLPVWYFLNLYQFLKLAKTGLEDRLIILGLPALIGAVLVLLPFIDKNPSHRAKDRPVVLGIAALFSIGVLYYTYAGWQSEQPAPVLTHVLANPSYRKNLLPIFNADCTPCHTGPAGGDIANFHITTYTGIMRGGILGPAVDVKNPAQSHLILLLEGKDPAAPGLQMPLGGKPLTKIQIQTIENWIKNGAKNN